MQEDVDAAVMRVDVDWSVSTQVPKGSNLAPLHRRKVRGTLRPSMSKKFTKRKKFATDPAAATPEQKLLARQRFLAARALRKRRQRKSNQ